MRLRDSQEAVRMAFETLRTNKLRSGLTVLGISIGISTVILISSAINGLNSNIDGFVKSLGTNTFWIFRFEPFGGRPSTEMLNRKQLTYDDAMAIRALPHVVAVDPALRYQDFQLGIGAVSIKYGKRKINNTILGGDSTDLAKTSNVTLIKGRLWTEDEETRRANVVVLGHDAAADLFQNEEPIGKEIEVDGDVFTVIGVFDNFPQPFGGGRNTEDNSAFFPVETFRKIHPEIKDYWLGVKYDDAKNKAPCVPTKFANCCAAAVRCASSRATISPSLAPIAQPALEFAHQWTLLFHGRRLFGGLNGRRRRCDEHHAGIGHRTNA